MRVPVGAGVDHDRVVGPIRRLIGRDRHHHPVVLRLAKGLPLPLAHAHNRVGRPVHAEFLADRVAVAHQVVHNVVAHHRVVRRVVNVGFGQRTAVVDVQVVQGKHRRRIAADLRIGAGVAVVHHVGAAVQQRAHFLAVGAALQDRLVVLIADNLALLKLEVIVRAHDDRRHPRDRENIRPVAGKFGAEVVVGGVGQGDDHNHRGNAHDHADNGQHRAQLVGPQRLHREFQGFLEVHPGSNPWSLAACASGFSVASTGGAGLRSADESLAARRVFRRKHFRESQPNRLRTGADSGSRAGTAFCRRTERSFFLVRSPLCRLHFWQQASRRSSSDRAESTRIVLASPGFIHRG